MNEMDNLNQAAIKGKRPARSSLAYTYGVRVCLECRAAFWPRRADALYCEEMCRVASHNREAVRAKAVYRQLYHWRKKRGAGGASFSDITRQVDAWIKEDKEAGRKAPPLLER